MIATALTLTEKTEVFFEKCFFYVISIIVHHGAYSVSIQFRWWHGVSVACHGVVDCYECSLSINVLLMMDSWMMSSMNSMVLSIVYWWWIGVHFMGMNIAMSVLLPVSWRAVFCRRYTNDTKCSPQKTSKVSRIFVLTKWNACGEEFSSTRVCW